MKGLRDLLNFTRANAGRAHPEALARAIHQSANRLEVQVPAPIGDVVSVADPVSELGTATANFANSCHKTEISRMFRKSIIAMLGILEQPRGPSVPRELPVRLRACENRLVGNRVR